jgi:hypothetical protein
MGNCDRELGPPPPDWPPNFWDYFEEHWRPIFEAMKELKVLAAMKEKELKVCSSRALSFCGNELFQELTIGLPKCMPEFYKLCDFDRLIRICPFDPAWDAFEWKQQVVAERLQALEVQVKELQVKLQIHK